jgi:PAS domain S-box-containing protein
VLPVGVAVAEDPGCEVITGNAALSSILGLKQGDNLSGVSLELPFEVLQAGRVLGPEEMPVQQAARSGKTTGLVELEVVVHKTSPRFLLASASPLFDEVGAVRGAVGAFFDVTDRKCLDDALRERAELLELASEAIMVRDASGAIRFWNAGAEALYGWKREEVLGRNVHELLCTQFTPGEEEMHAVLAESGRWEGNLKQCRKDGRELVVASRQAVQIGKASILEINRDITDQLFAEEALRRNERLAAMGKLAGMVAHEINNPLEAITNAFYLLNGHPSLDSEARYYAQLAEQELARVSHITRQTLSFYRESQQAVSILVSDLLDNVLELQQRPIQMKNIQLERRYSSNTIIHGFPSELKQVFMNLISNAIQAMPDGGRMRIRVSQSLTLRGRPSGVQIFVSDTGGGIAPEHAKRLFEPFFTTKSVKGTGLGLWISRGIVHKHEGTLRFRSLFRASGTVTSFHITLPIYPAV